MPFHEADGSDRYDRVELWAADHEIILSVAADAGQRISREFDLPLGVWREVLPNAHLLPPDPPGWKVSLELPGGSLDQGEREIRISHPSASEAEQGCDPDRRNP